MNIDFAPVVILILVGLGVVAALAKLIDWLVAKWRNK